MNTWELQWREALDKRRQDGNVRQLRSVAPGVDFWSNDYLGLSSNVDFQHFILKSATADARCLTGATGARLISGNSLMAMQTEDFIAAAHQVESALLFPSGYKGNLALFSCIAGRHDTILVDELIHRSVHDGCLMSKAEKWKFRHNDLSHLEDLLKRAKGKVIIAVESLYSMDGDFAPLSAIVDLSTKYGAGLVVDEAHAMGVFGMGLVHAANLQRDVLATVVTFGKAMGVQGAAVLGNHLLKEYLINFASPFIYSTAMPDIQVLSIRAAYDYLAKHSQPALSLQERIRHFRSYGLSGISQEASPIQVIRFSSTHQLREATRDLQQADILAYALFAPTVRAGAERLRVCVHAFNSNQEIDELCAIINQYEYY
nr:pyridoxal phosphate-dependent aminotransferase family protein [uncultured Dyadobacter sp.]